ncbi:MAG: hypothetical protein NTU93_09970 [Arthrobacter sp.]|nr:hypothetical protein [Arthrobacter sp.]
MFLHDLGKGLLRRWYFVVIGILLTVCGALFVTTVVPPTYKGTARIVLIPPGTLVTSGGNPYLFLGGLEQALSVLGVRLGSGSVGEQVLNGHPGRSYVAEKDPLSPGPIMLITTEAESPESSLRVLDDVLKVVPQNLEGMQDQLNVPASSRITALTIVREDNPKIDTKSQLRAVLGSVAAGGAMTVLLTGSLDRLLSSPRRARRRRRQDTEPETESGHNPVGEPASAVQGNEQGTLPTSRSKRRVSAQAPAAEEQPPGPDVAKDELPTMASNK